MSVCTREHRLELTGGRRVLVTVTETPEVVFLNIHGDKAWPAEQQRVADFLLPIVAPYETDPRPIEMDGPRAPCAMRIASVTPTLTVAHPVERARGHA